MTDAPRIERVRHELRRRQLQVLRVESLAPAMRRVVLGGPQLEGFTSLGFDDHVKLLFPTPAGAEPAMRDFTPRRFDSTHGELAVDFFVHETGPASDWIRAAAVGDTLTVAGPKGSVVVATEGIDLHVLIGDETAVPAIARRLEELPAQARAEVVVEAEEAAPWLALPTRPQDSVQWVARRPGDAPAAAVIAALERHGEWPARTFFWIAGESRMARALRRWLREARDIDLAWIKASGYWQRGAAGAHERIADDGGALADNRPS